jgi:hypothetical protein
MKTFRLLAIGCFILLGSCSDTATGNDTGPDSTIVWDTSVADTMTAETQDVPPANCDGRPEGTACDDGDPCTLEDACTSGVCVGGANDPCTSQDPCSVGSCVAQTGCLYEHIADGTTCQATCFGEASCQAGVCQAVAASKTVCPAVEEHACVDSIQCDPATGECTKEIVKSEGEECDTDGNLCTKESCDSGAVCVATDQVNTCEAETKSDPCQYWDCNTKTGDCEGTGFAGEISCNDGNECTKNDTCEMDEFSFISCKGTSLPVDDGNECTDDYCVDGTVNHDPIEGLPCDTGDACTPLGLCADGLCEFKGCECVVDGDCPDTPCMQNKCDPDTGTCQAGEPVNCDNGLFCDGKETCDPAQGCQSGATPKLDDGVNCTVDSCDEASKDILHTPNNALCEGGLCMAGTCNALIDCQLEKIANCCGNNITEPGEECDDGNDKNGDGCASNCTMEGMCQDKCPAKGKTLCINGSKLQTCSDTNGDGCLEWGPAQPCPSGTCVNGACSDEPEPDCSVPVAALTGLGGSGNGACDVNDVLVNDGNAAELWAGTNNTWDSLGVPVSACVVVDFGKLCTPKDICVEAWASDKGCSGDTCEGPCTQCKNQSKTALDVFAYKTNSTLSYVYQYSMYIDATGNPGKTMCYKPTDEPIRYVMVCRADCGAKSANAQVDYVWLE